MSKTIVLGGNEYVVPDNATLPQIQSFLESQGVRAPKTTAASPDNRTAQQVMVDQMNAVPRGVVSAVTGIPAAVKGLGSMVYDTVMGNSRQAQQTLGGMAKGIVQPFTTTARGLGALAVPNAVEAPSREEWESAAEGSGALLGGALLGEALPAARNALVSVAKRNPALAASLQARAAVNTAKALRPVTLEDRAVVQKIAPELSRRGLDGLTGKSIDRKLGERLTEAQTNLNQVEARLSAEARPEFQVHMEPLVAKVNTAIAKLKVKGTTKSVNPAAVQALEEVRDLFEALPKYADFDQVLDLRRKLDSAVDDAGGFRESASAADRVTMKARRGGADIARAALNELDPALRKANQDYSLYRHAVDVVERRQLGDVGASGSGLPGRFSILDDVIAGWVGEAIGGKTGAALVEGANLLRQTRGYAGMKAGAQQALANRLQPGTPAARAMLGVGAIPLGPGADASGIRVTQTPNPAQRLSLPSPSTDVNATVRYGPSGPAGGYRMPPITPKLLATGQRALSETAGAPYTTPYRPSLLEEAKRLSRAPGKGVVIVFDVDRMPLAIVDTATGRIIKDFRKDQ